MFRAMILSLVPLSLLATPAFAEPSAGTYPSANTLFQLQRVNRAHPWFRILTDSGAVTRRVGSFDRLGLYSLTAADGTRSPGPLPWPRIRRVDELLTRSHSMRVVGAAVLGLAGAGIGNALGAPTNSGARYAGLGLGLGCQLGGTLGAGYGRKRPAGERAWYVATEAAAAPPAPDSAAPAAPPALDPVVATTGGGPAGTAMMKAAAAITPNRRIRMLASFGTFEGRAGESGPDGLGKLTPRRRSASGADVPALVPWSAIDRIEVRAGSSLSAGLGGAILFGGMGALLGAAAVSVAQSDVSAGTAAAQGAAYAAPVGFGLGALAGMAARRWVVLYRRP